MVIFGCCEGEMYDVVVFGVGFVGQNVVDCVCVGGLCVVVVECEFVGGECFYWVCVFSKVLLCLVIVIFDV